MSSCMRGRPSSSKPRRRAQRAPSSDHIEEESALSQQHAEDVDNNEGSEEDVQPARKSATVKKEKKPKTARNDRNGPAAGPSKSNHDGGVEDDDGRIDIENFHDQPLDRKEAAKLHGIAQDWEMIRKQIHQSSFRLVRDVAISLADVMEGGEVGEALDEVDSIMKRLLDIDQEMRSHEATLSNLHQSLMRGEVVESVLETYGHGVKRQMDEYNKKTTRQKYASSETYVEFRQRIHEVQNPGQGIPPISEFVPREDGDPSDDEEEVEVGGVTQDYKCPITLRVLENPMTSRVCGHSYSRAAIREFLTSAGRDGKLCPASGCNKRITMEQLKDDKELEKRIKIAARRQQRQQEESEEDDDQVIE